MTLNRMDMLLYTIHKMNLMQTFELIILTQNNNWV